MEIKAADRVLIAKPVASRPTCSGFSSFSELLTGSIGAAPPSKCSETAVPAIRPMTLRFKTIASCTQTEPPGEAVFCSSDKALNSVSRSTVLYKPLAKPVSKTTVSLLANMQGAFHSIHNHQQPLAQVEAPTQHPNQDKHPLGAHLGSNFCKNLPSSAMDRDQTTEPSKIVSQSMEDDNNPLMHASSTDRPSYDGYNWRKYGQKQVKGSEYPRSYYRCTHPSCPVKKKVERSLDGQIAEIVYKGEHNHSKPQPPKRNSAGAQGQGFVSDGSSQDINHALWTNSSSEKNVARTDGRVENQKEVGLSSQYTGKAPLFSVSLTTGEANGTSDNSCGLSGECEERSKVTDDSEPKSKRRKRENLSAENAGLIEGTQEPRIVVQNSTDTEIFGDGFRWRKYGQKVVKGNPYPRSYYRCTTLKCNVRKHVERSADDPKAFIMTYEGKHNHGVPNRGNNLEAPEP